MDYAHMSIGLFGGSFNPAHAGHLHVATMGLNTLGLDQVWWMVSPQNPLKPKQPSYASRVKTVEALNLPSRMCLSHMEQDFGTQYTIDTILAACRRWPHTRFVFLMGADNFLQLPKWKSWRTIIETVPIAIISRPGADNTALRARLGQAARTYSKARVPEWQAHILKECEAPAWSYLTPPLNPLSSSSIRAKAAKR